MPIDPMDVQNEGTGGTAGSGSQKGYMENEPLRQRSGSFLGDKIDKGEVSAEGTPTMRHRENVRPDGKIPIPVYLAEMAGSQRCQQPVHKDVVHDSDHVTLTFPDGSTHDLPIKSGVMGAEKFIDIATLFAKKGYFTYDPGMTNTATCSSAITFIDGGEGRCLYRGYPVADLCEQCDYLEVCYLLLWGELPMAAERDLFSQVVMQSSLVHEKFKKFFDGFPDQTHPMAIMVSACGALSAFFHDSLDIWSEADREVTAMRLIGKLPTIAAMAYKTAIGEPIVYPKAELSYAANFLHMMFATPVAQYKVNPIHAKALDKFLSLHADHEQNASTSTVRIAGSSQANPFACISAGIASLWGPAHGGANEAVIDMLNKIGHEDNIDQFLADVKAKKDGVRLMGFGHRVYKNFDPRARYMKTLVQEVLSDLDQPDPDLNLAMALEKKALEDEYFVKRKLYPNVDFYSGILLRAIGIPTVMYTVLFALGRCIGWIAQWRELVSEKQMRIGRPRQIYVGVEERSVAAAKLKEGDSTPSRVGGLPNASMNISGNNRFATNHKRGSTHSPPSSPSSLGMDKRASALLLSKIAEEGSFSPKVNVSDVE